MTNQPQTTRKADYARDHLANDRTYLAWVRTSLNVIILGLVVAKFIEGDEAGRAQVAGMVLIVVGCFILTYGTIRSYRTTREIERGRYALHHGGTLSITFLVALAVIVTVTLLYW
jgi:putative membrane protein